MPDKLSLLKRYWGYDSFRPMQEEIIDSVLQGHDTLALLPTAGGKSLCYQLPALMRDGLCLVVSPLVALMKDQVQQLNNRKLKASCLVAGMSSNEVTAILYNAIAGQIKYLYVSPERLRQRRFIEHLRKMKVGLIAVDEAHCISQWGYDFRPPYLQIADIRPLLPGTPLLALTATATDVVQKDIVRLLLMHDCRTICGSFLRPNLTYSVVQAERKKQAMMDVVRRCRGCGIIYVRSRRLTRDIAAYLVSEGVPATFYHAGLESAERDWRQQQWMRGECEVMVATNAFGMGIDKPDVRFVIHLDLPESLEAYFQEAGRAGRDGHPSEAVLICDKYDVGKAIADFESDYPSVRYVRNTYRALCNYYKLPIGSGADSRFDFELEDVCATYNMKVREFYSSCRLLDRQGLISLPDRESVASRLYIPATREQLYRFQVNHMALGNLLQVLLRLYPGVLTEPVAIREDEVAGRCMMEPDEVIARLKQMQAMHILEYYPRTEKPQIIFLCDRVAENEIYLNDISYSDQKQAARRRLDAICHYATSADVCRQRQLLAYFGQSVDADCGRCDVCRRRNVVDTSDEDVLAALAEGVRMPIHELTAMLERQGRTEVVATVRRMLDEGTLFLDDNLYLAVKR